MTLPETLDHILDRIITVSDRTQFLSILDSLSSDSFNVKTDIAKLISDTVPESFAQALFAYFQRQKIDVSNAQKVAAVLSQLKESLGALPTFTIRIAVEPTRTMLSETRAWIQKNTGQTVVLRTVIDPSLIAGAQLEWNGVYKDLSFTKSFEDKKETIITHILA